MDADRRDTAVLTELQKAKHWVKNEMEEWVWIPITERQKEIIKVMIVEWYGWPVFSLNFNNDLTKIMKCKL